MKHLFYSHRSVCRFLFASRKMCSKAAPTPTVAATNESNAKVIYSVARSLGHNEVGHIECNARVVLILRALEKAKLSPKFRESEIIQLENYRTATLEDVARVHSMSYISSLQKSMEDASASENGVLRIEGPGPSYFTPTTFQDSLDAAGAGLSVVDSVVAASKISDDPPVGFAMIRPPGHHAVPTGPMGFCFFGNVAIAARYAQHVHGLKRVFIIDFDVHHGNGTNDAFYDDPDIFFLSTHQDGDFPRGTGKFEDIGCGNGEGATLNLPLPERTGETGMRTVFDEVIVPAAQRFKPDIILVSAGYDGHVLDPVGNFQLTARTYHTLALNIKQLAKDLCGGRCAFFMEGGYKLGTLSFSVAETFRAFIGEPSLATEFDKKYAAFLQDEPTCKINEAIQKIKSLHSL